MRRLVMSLVVVTLGAACTRQLPPPAAPARVKPEVSQSPDAPPPNHGRVVIDAGPGEVRVERIEGRSTLNGRTVTHVSRLCTAPCAVDLGWGTHELSLTSADGNHRDVVELDVRAPFSVSRIAVGERHGSKVVPFVGGTLAVIGAFTVGVILNGMLQGDTDGEEQMLVLGVGSLALGSTLWYFGRPVEQDSSITTWTP
jgi:hypothetical protein